MNLVSMPDGRVINLDHLTYAERTGEYVVLHFTGGGDAGSGSIIRLKVQGGFGRIWPKNERRRSGRLVKETGPRFLLPKYAGSVSPISYDI